jgi:fibronectin-binding autotransporter adhesin
VAAAQVVWMASNQVSDAVVITLFNTDAASGGLSLNGCVETVGGVVSVGAASGTAFVENGLGAGPATLTVSNAADGVYAGTMRDGGLALNIVKTGPGRWTLNGPCANTGTWTIDGGTLGGTGALSGPVTVNAAAIAPGDGGPGTLTMSGNLTLSENAALDFEIGTPGAPGSDLIDGVNNLVLDGTLNVTALPGLGALPPGSVWRLINYHGWLANNGLKIGARPAGVALWVETGTPGQVNLMSLPTGVMMIVR